MYIVIINSYSGRRRYNLVLKLLNENLSSSYKAFLSHKFQGKDMYEEIRNAITPYESELKGIIVVGGDGTLHQAVNELYSLRLPFGLIPSGSGNDFARAIKIPGTVRKAIGRINNDHAQQYDILEVNNRKVLSIIGVGVDAETAINCQTSIIKKLLNRAFLGRLTYLAVFLKTVTRYKPLDVNVISEDGNTHSFTNVWLLAAGNTSYYGGGIPMCPEADPRDGEIDLVVVHSLGFFRLLAAIPSVYLKRHLSLPYITSLKGRKFTIQSKGRQAVQGDGEEIGVTPAYIKVHRNAVKFF
jgi:YegS/Rv2252/BmrU family lipid kinase